MRLCDPWTEAAMDRASIVLPVPGASSRSRCPSASMQVSARRTTGALPRTAWPTFPTSRSKVWANQAACSGVIVVISSFPYCSSDCSLLWSRVKKPCRSWRDRPPCARRPATEVLRRRILSVPPGADAVLLAVDQDAHLGARVPEEALELHRAVRREGVRRLGRTRPALRVVDDVVPAAHPGGAVGEARDLVAARVEVLHVDQEVRARGMAALPVVHPAAVGHGRRRVRLLVRPRRVALAGGLPLGVRHDDAGLPDLVVPGGGGRRTALLGARD